jgi:hypothetical protein
LTGKFAVRATVAGVATAVAAERAVAAATGE